MRIEILGSLTATVGGKHFIPSAMKPRQLLALLIANSNRYVSQSAITKELWGTTPPRSAANTVQTYVMQIRKLLDSALAQSEGMRATDVLVTGVGGYQLSVAPGDIDLTRYLDLAADGESALLDKDYVRAAHKLADALAMWRDDALCNVRRGPMLDTFVREMDDSRTITLERRIEAELCLGQHYGVLRELTELTRTHPLNENLHSQFMLALYRAGRRVQALKVYQRLRKRMTEELGLDPSPRLQQLQTAVLNCDRSLEFENRPGLFSSRILPAC
ncbi:AfsR/SARP family transcriptional regulator [Streptomyces olivaceoviridis]|uniref:AfsR/SARP family transcriptional regulator n=1 Tax=Streptomyces olivaceoviridis TaxID=1921 RepID=UPI00202F4372